MSLGPIEVLVIGFPGSRFNGQIIPELRALVDAGTIAVVDALLVRKDEDSTITMLEFGEEGVDPELAALGDVLRETVALISDDDVTELAEALEPGDAAALLVFEHSWAKGFHDAVVGSGGQLLADFRVPAEAVDEVLAALAEDD